MALSYHFKFDGSTANSGSASNTITNTSVTFSAVGKNSGSAVFGSSSYLTFGTTFYLNHNADWTVSVWVKTTNSGTMSIFSNQSGGPVANDLRIENGKMVYYHYNGGWLTKTGTATVNDGKWHHLVWMNYSTSRMTMYVDGQPNNPSGAQVFDSTMSGLGAIDRLGRNWAGNNFVGEMDEVRVYTAEVIGDGEIARLAGTVGLVRHWPLTGNLSEYSGLGASLTSPSGDNTQVTGKIGLGYTKTSGYYLTDLSYLPGDLTISMWFRHNGTDWVSECLFGTRLNSDGFMVYRNDGDGDNYYRVYYWYINTSNTVVGYNTWPGITGIAADTWYHLTVVRTFSGQMRIYINGALNQTQNPPADFKLWHNNGATLAFHGQGNGSSYTGGNYTFNDFRVYNYALSEYEVREIAKAEVLHYSFDSDSEEATTNLITGASAYPDVGNAWGTYYTGQYNSNTYFSIGSIVSVSNNIVTTDGSGRAIYTYDVLRPQTTGGGVTAGTDYFIKVVGTNQFTLHAYNSSQDGSQGYINPETGDHKVFDSIALDQRISVNSTSFPTMWWGAPHLPNSALVKEIVPNVSNSDSFNGHSFIRLNFDHKSGAVDGGMAYGFTPSLTNGVTYAISFWYRAADYKSIDKGIYMSAYSGGGWATNSGTLYPKSFWQRAVWYGTPPVTGTTYFYWFPTNNSNIDMSEIQLEAKSAATPFVLGTRSFSASDGSGLKNLATSSSTPVFSSSSKIGSGNLTFDGTSSLVSTGFAAANLGQEFTISAWVFPTAASNYRGVAGDHLNYTGIIFSQYENNGFYFGYGTGSAWVTVGSSALTLNQWSHIVMTLKTGTGGFGKVFVNGVQAGSTLSNPTAISHTAGNLLIGRAYNDTNRYWQGRIDEFKVFTTALSDSDIAYLYNRRGNFDNLGRVSVSEIDLTSSYYPTLVDYSTWTVGQTSATGWSRNGSAAENIIVLRDNPIGIGDIAWATLSNDATSDADGGYESGTFAIDATKTYRYTTWIKRENYGTGSGTTYFGIYGRNTADTNIGVETLAGANNTNPYPITWSANGYSTGSDWILCVQYVMPAGSTSETELISSTRGLYKQDGTRLTSTGTTFRWRSDNTRANIRSYLYYSTKTDERQYWYRPRFEEVTASTPSIETLLACAENPTLTGKTIANITKKALINSAGQAVFTDIDEVSQSLPSGTEQSISDYGTLTIEGEFSEVD